MQTIVDTTLVNRSLILKIKKNSSYLDAERCAALEELLYVAQALAVVFRFWVNLEGEKRKLRLKGRGEILPLGVSGALVFSNWGEM